MHLVRSVDVDEYWRIWTEFDRIAKFLELTPADRHIAWVEKTADEHFTEWPVPMSHFMQDPYYVGPEVVVRPMIAEFLSDFWEPAQGYELFVFIGGLGSGKSFSASLSLMYALYCLSTLHKPQRYLSGFPGAGQLSGDASIVLMNASAAGAKQASKVVYGEAFEKIVHSPYFKMNFQPYPYMTSELEFPNNIRLVPGTSDWHSALGWNLFGSVIDEAAFGTTTDAIDYVRELFLNLNMRRRSRFGTMGFTGLFTSPGSESGFVELLAAEDWDPTLLVRRCTTWDAKDELHPDTRVFLLDRDPDSVRVLESDLVYVKPGTCMRAETGEIVRYKTRPVEESVKHAAVQLSGD